MLGDFEIKLPKENVCDICGLSVKRTVEKKKAVCYWCRKEKRQKRAREYAERKNSV